MKLSVLLTLIPTLNALGELKLSGKVRHNISRNILSAKREVTAYEETRKSFLDTYGKLSEDGMQYSFPEEGSREAFTKAHNDLLDAETVERFFSIPYAELEKLEFEGKHLAILMDCDLISDLPAD